VFNQTIFPRLSKLFRFARPIDECLAHEDALPQRQVEQPQFGGQGFQFFVLVVLALDALKERQAMLLFDPLGGDVVLEHLGSDDFSAEDLYEQFIIYAARGRRLLQPVFKRAPAFGGQPITLFVRPPFLLDVAIGDKAFRLELAQLTVDLLVRGLPEVP
jgi:hypothetical protein